MKLLYLFLILLLSPFYLRANAIDSLEKVYPKLQGKEKLLALIEIASSNFGAFPEISHKYFHILYKESVKQKDSIYIGMSLANISAINYKRGKYKDAIDTFQLAAKHYEKINYKPGLVFVYSQIGTALATVGKYDDAAKNFTKALSYYTFKELLDSVEYYNKLGSKINEHQKRLISVHAIAINDFGWYYEKINYFDKALEYYDKAYKLGSMLKRKDRTGAALSNIGKIYVQKERFEEAEQAYLKAIEDLKEINHLNYLAFTYDNLSVLHTKTKEYDEARKYAFEALEYFKILNDSSHSVFITLGIIETETKNYKKAIEYLKQAERVFIIKNLPYNLIHTYSHLTDAYEFLGDYKNALFYSKKNIAIADSTLNAVKLKDINQLLAFYDVDSKSKEIELYKKDVALSHAQLKQNQYLTYVYLFLTAILLLVICALIFHLYNKSKTKKIIELKNAELEKFNENLNELNESKDKFFSIIAHDIKNPLASLKQVSELLLNDAFDLSEQDRREFTESLQKSSSNLLELLNNLLTWARSQSGKIITEPHIISLDKIIKQEIEYLEGQAKKKKIDVLFEDSHIEVFADYNMVSIIIRNLLSNSIKYTPNSGVVEISAGKKDNEYGIVKFKDNGVGLSESVKEKLFVLGKNRSERGTDDEEGTGLGLIVCKEFVEKNNGEIGFEESVSKGSTFYFTLPLKGSNIN